MASDNNTTKNVFRLQVSAYTEGNDMTVRHTEFWQDSRLMDNLSHEHTLAAFCGIILHLCDSVPAHTLPLLLELIKAKTDNKQAE